MDTLYGISAEQIAERTGVDVSTARRWKAGATRLPHAAKLVLDADLGCFSREARGWRIEGPELVSPEGWRITLNEIRAVPMLRQQLHAYQAELRDRKHQRLMQLEEQPLPEGGLDTAVQSA